MNQFEPLGDGKDWARKIMRRYLAGEKLNIYPLRCAREVLGVPEPPRVHRAHPSVAPVNDPADAPFERSHAMTPAEAYYAAEQAARSALVTSEEVIT